MSLTDLSTILNSVEGGLDAVAAIVEDPYFPPTVQKVLELRDMVSMSGGTGVGLSSLQFPLDALIAARRNPWLPWAAGIAFLALPFFLGYAVGRR